MLLYQIQFSLSFTFCYQLDCGIHPGISGLAGLPYLDFADPSEVDLLLVTQYALIYE